VILSCYHCGWLKLFFPRLQQLCCSLNPLNNEHLQNWHFLVVYKETRNKMDFSILKQHKNFVLDWFSETINGKNSRDNATRAIENVNPQRTHLWVKSDLLYMFVAYPDDRHNGGSRRQQPGYYFPSCNLFVKEDTPTTADHHCWLNYTISYPLTKSSDGHNTAYISQRPQNPWKECWFPHNTKIKWW